MGVDAVGKSGSLMLLWRKDLNVALQSFSSHHIDVTVAETGKDGWRFTGDFNEILTQEEKQRQLARPAWQMEGFRQSLEECQLIDMGSEGERFTWSNHREHPHTVQAHLDRACCTTDWMELFPQAIVQNLTIGGSDHCILQINLDAKDNQCKPRRAKQFRFEAAWLRDASCEEAIRIGWTSLGTKGEALTIHSRINHARINLLQWEKHEFGHIRSRVCRLEEGIQEIRKGCLTAAAKTRMEELKSELVENLAREEMMWKQRSKAEWLREGDKNTAFFHARASERRKKNTIRTLETEAGSLTSDRRIIKEVILRYL
ncbi:UNVERIFIED_CONTAM: hypothetical protein Slati_2902100 [Sesamum latifolium]|uniref:Endonuclease/exonuclease/phosphatase n=1 Tax=Sesamum latifolium TaxID=2727402 RepID=A0AAW2VDI5_9LAMI